MEGADAAAVCQGEHGFSAVPGADVAKAGGDQREGFLPARLPERTGSARPGADQRRGEPVRCVVFLQ